MSLIIFPTLPLLLIGIIFTEGSANWRERVEQARNAPVLDPNKKKIAQSLGAYGDWCSSHSIHALPFSSLAISGWIIDFVISLDGSTMSIDNKLSHLRVWAKLNNNNIFLDVIGEAELKELFKVLKYQDFKATRRVSPLTLPIIHNLINLRGVDSALGLAIATLYSLGHDGLLRGGELTSDLRGSDLSLSKEGTTNVANILLSRTKTHRKGAAITVTVADYNHPWSAVKNISKLYKARNLSGHPDRFLFPLVTFVKGTPSGLNFNKPMNRRALIQLLRCDLALVNLNPLLYAGHSFRAGGATDLFLSNNITLAQIMLCGRWITVEAAMKYFRAYNEASLKAALVFGSYSS